MTRNLRDLNSDDNEDNLNEIKDENGIVHTTSRSLRKINYAESDNGLDFIEDEDDIETKEEVSEVPIAAPYNEDSSEDNNRNLEDELVDEANEQISLNMRKKRQFHDEDDDDSFHEDELEEVDTDEDDANENLDDEYDEYNHNSRKRRMAMDRNFVVPDPESGNEGGNENDDDDEEAISYSNNRRRSRRTTSRRSYNSDVTTPPRRNLRSTTVKTNLSDNENADDDETRAKHLTLADEIRELQEDSPIQEKRSLRERTKPVNYTIPPPLSAANAEEYAKQQTGSFNNVSPSRRGGRAWNSMGPTRRLFPTGGPFGGNNVTTIFGQNTNFYNQGPSNSNDPNNKLILDSDSSEDEILALGATPKTTVGNPLKKKKKKPEIADLDPLGVDMNINFDDVGGLDNYIDQLKEMVTLPLLYPEVYQTFNIIPPRGVLFHGPPGTGKTLMARALAASCSSDTRKITFFMRKGADILSKWVGEAERQLRLLFEEAKKQQPSIIFFDEIDGLAPVRSSKQEQIHASIVSTLLALMDGMDNRGQVIVIGATNRPDAVDPALRRPGRFDREFYFPLPDQKARTTILKIHTKKWKTQLPENLIQNLAKLTKGYGGADLRALCTEAALSSIQRKFPQIYRSKEKLVVDTEQLKVNRKDFMLALKKIVPSSARSTASTNEPLPNSVKPLLENQFIRIKQLLKEILPLSDLDVQTNKSSIQNYIDYEDVDEDDDDYSKSNDFDKYELLDQINDSRICKPKLLITGPEGNGQQYIGAAILNHLEHFNVQKLDLSSLVSESNRSMEAAVIQGFVEARKRQPSIIFIPNIDIWCKSVPESVISTLASLFRSLQSKEKILLLGISESPLSDFGYDQPIAQLSMLETVYNMEKPTAMEKIEYFKSLKTALMMNPISFQTKRKRTKPLATLPPVPIESLPENLDEDGKPLTPEEIMRRKLKDLQYQDMKLKNVLKIKLSGLMDLFKNRYKRFRKPPIDDTLLIHLFEPPIDPTWQPAYVKDDDMIMEVATGKRFYNMDLDIVEERLWNGFYSEPKQYLRDIELIYLDANTMGDRERVIKASEMFANAQMGIEDISTPEFVKECKLSRRRDLERKELFLKDLEIQTQEEKGQVEKNINDADVTLNTEPTESEKISNFENCITEVGVAAGNQLQAQLKIINPIVDDNSISHQINHEVSQSVSAQEVPVPAMSSEQTFATVELNEPIVTTTSAQVNNSAILTTNDNYNGSTPNVSNETISNNKVTNEISPIEDQIETRVLSPINIIEPEKDKTVSIDMEMLDRIFSLLISQTDDVTISELEQFYAKLINIIWQNRFDWDKSKTLEQLEVLIGK